MSEKFDQLKIMQEMFPNATFVDANGERVADTSKTIDHIADVSKKVSLTEQWRNGELDRNKLYYYETPFMTTDSASGFWLSNNLDKEEDKVKILSEVPSYEQWQSLNELLDSMQDTNKVLAHKLNICKKLLKEAKEKFVNLDYAKGLIRRIDEVLK